MATITTRAGKGSPLTNSEVDSNFTNLNTDKLEDTDLSVSTASASGGGSLSYSSAVFTFTPPDLSSYLTNLSGSDTDDLSEGVTNLYFTSERVDDRVATLLQAGNGIDLDYSDVNNELTITSEVMEITAYNGTGSTLSKGTVVYQTGVQGSDISVAAATNTSTSTMPAVGIVIADIANAATGKIAVSGFVKQLDTSAFSVGDVLYVGASGALTATKPTGQSALIQNFGRAIKINAASGEILISGAGRTNDTPNLNDGNVFIGNASNQAEARALAASDIASGTFADARISQSSVTQHFSGGTGVTITSGSIAIGQAVGTTDNVTFGNVSVTGITLGGTAITATGAEINYVDGVTSNIQTQLDGKFNADSNLQSFVTTFTLPTSDGTSGQSLTTNGSGTLAFSNVDADTLDGQHGAYFDDRTINALGSVSGTTDIDLADGTNVTATIGAATTFTVSGLTSGKVNTVTMYLTNAGAYTVTWPSGTVFNRNTAPTLPSAGDTLIVLETYDNGTSWAGIQVWRDTA